MTKEEKENHLKMLDYILQELYCYINEESVKHFYEPTILECKKIIKNKKEIKK